MEYKYLDIFINLYNIKLLDCLKNVIKAIIVRFEHKWV